MKWLVRAVYIFYIRVNFPPSLPLSHRIAFSIYSSSGLTKCSSPIPFNDTAGIPRPSFDVLLSRRSYLQSSLNRNTNFIWLVLLLLPIVEDFSIKHIFLSRRHRFYSWIIAFLHTLWHAPFVLSSGCLISLARRAPSLLLSCRTLLMDPFHNPNQMIFQHSDDQGQGHVFQSYNYQQQSTVPTPSASQQPYITYANGPADPKNPMNVVPATQPAYMQGMQQPQQMFSYNYPAQGQPHIPQPSQGQDAYFQQNVMRYAANQPPHNQGRGRGNRGMRGANRFYAQTNGYPAYGMPTHSFGSNNAVPEKTPTVRLMNPGTQKVNHIKLNRIYPTMADVRSEASSQGCGAAGSKPTKLVLCLENLAPQGCPHGSGCHKVHISDMQHMWEPVEATLANETTYNPGFFFRCYDASQTHYLSVPSEYMEVTKGSAEYIVMYNQHGENFKSKYVLCSAFMQSGACERGDQCPNLHCTEKDMERLFSNDANTTHQNNVELMANVPRLSADIVVRAFDQNSSESYHDYLGTQVLMTQGARTYLKSLEGDQGGFPSRRRMQHCAHFRLKDMCRLGESCRFLHVLSTPEELQERDQSNAAAHEMRNAGEDRRATTHNPYINTLTDMSVISLYACPPKFFRWWRWIITRPLGTHGDGTSTERELLCLANQPPSHPQTTKAQRPIVTIITRDQRLVHLYVLWFLYVCCKENRFKHTQSTEREREKDYELIYSTFSIIFYVYIVFHSRFFIFIFYDDDDDYLFILFGKTKFTIATFQGGKENISLPLALERDRENCGEGPEGPVPARFVLSGRQPHCLDRDGMQMRFSRTHSRVARHGVTGRGHLPDTCNERERVPERASEIESESEREGKYRENSTFFDFFLFDFFTFGLRSGCPLTRVLYETIRTTVRLLPSSAGPLKSPAHQCRSGSAWVEEGSYLRPALPHREWWHKEGLKRGEGRAGSQQSEHTTGGGLRVLSLNRTLSATKNCIIAVLWREANAHIHADVSTLIPQRNEGRRDDKGDVADPLLRRGVPVLCGAVPYGAGAATFVQRRTLLAPAGLWRRSFMLYAPELQRRIIVLIISCAVRLSSEVNTIFCPRTLLTPISPRHLYVHPPVGDSKKTNPSFPANIMEGPARLSAQERTLGSRGGGGMRRHTKCIGSSPLRARRREQKGGEGLSPLEIIGVRVRRFSSSIYLLCCFYLNIKQKEKTTHLPPYLRVLYTSLLHPLKVRNIPARFCSSKDPVYLASIHSFALFLLFLECSIVLDLGYSLWCFAELKHTTRHISISAERSAGKRLCEVTEKHIHRMVYHAIVLKKVSGQQVRLAAPLTLCELLDEAVQRLHVSRSSVKIRLHDSVAKVSDLMLAHGERADVETLYRSFLPPEATAVVPTAPVASAARTELEPASSMRGPLSGAASSPTELTIMVFGAVDKFHVDPHKCEARVLPSGSKAPIRMTGDQLRDSEAQTWATGEMVQGHTVEGPIPFPLCPYGLDDLLRVLIEETTTGSGASIPAVFPVMAFYTPGMQFIIQYVRRDLNRLEEVMRQIARYNEDLYAWLAAHPRLFLRLINNDGPTTTESQRYALVLFARQVAQGTMELLPGRQEYMVEFGSSGEHNASNVKIDFTVDVPEEEEDWEEGDEAPFDHTFAAVPQTEDEVIQMLAGVLFDGGEESEASSSQGEAQGVGCSDPEPEEPEPEPEPEPETETETEEQPALPTPSPTVKETPAFVVFPSLSRVEMAAEGVPSHHLTSGPLCDVRDSIASVVTLIESNPLFWLPDLAPPKTPRTGVRPVSPSIRQIRSEALAIINAHHRIQEVSVQLVQELGKSLVLPDSDHSLGWFLRMAEAFFSDTAEFYASLSRNFYQNDAPSAHPVRASLHSTFEGAWRDSVDAFGFMAAVSRLLVVSAARHLRAAGRIAGPESAPPEDPTARDSTGAGGKSRRFDAIRQLSCEASPLHDPSLRWMSSHGVRSLMEGLMSAAKRQKTAVVLYTAHRYTALQRPPPPPPKQRRGSMSSSSSSSSSAPTDPGEGEEEAEAAPAGGGVRFTAFVVRGDTERVHLQTLPSHPVLHGNKHDETLATLLRLSLSSEGVDGVPAALQDMWHTLMRQHYDALVAPILHLLPAQSSDPQQFFYVVDTRLAPSYLHGSAPETAAAAAFSPARFFPALCDRDGTLVAQRWATCAADSLWSIVQAHEAPVIQPPAEDGGPTRSSSLLLTTNDTPPAWLQPDLQLRLVFHQQNVRSQHRAGVPQHMAILHEEAPRVASSGASSSGRYRRQPPLLVGDLRVVDEFMQPSAAASALRRHLASHNINLLDDAEGYGCEDGAATSSSTAVAICQRALEFYAFSQAYTTFHATLVHNAAFTYPPHSSAASMTDVQPSEATAHPAPPAGENAFFAAFYRYLVDHPDHPLATAVCAVSVQRAERNAAPWQVVECSLLDYGGPLAALPLLQRSSLSEAAAVIAERAEAQYVGDNGVDDVFEMMINHLLDKGPVGEMDVLDELIQYLDENKAAAQQVVEDRRHHRASSAGKSAPTSRLHAEPAETRKERRAVRKANPFPAVTGAAKRERDRDPRPTRPGSPSEKH
eukprot:gene4954-3554_t